MRMNFLTTLLGAVLATLILPFCIEVYWPIVVGVWILFLIVVAFFIKR